MRVKVKQNMDKLWSKITTIEDILYWIINADKVLDYLQTNYSTSVQQIHVMFNERLATTIRK